jgi:hypothetical protein
LKTGEFELLSVERIIEPVELKKESAREALVLKALAGIPDLAIIETKNELRHSQVAKIDTDAKTVEGTPIVLTGYGCEANLAWQKAFPAGKARLRFGRSVIGSTEKYLKLRSGKESSVSTDAAGSLSRIVFVSPTNVEKGSSTPTLCAGDSGGPVLDETGSKIVGINSIGLQTSLSVLGINWTTANIHVPLNIEGRPELKKILDQIGNGSIPVSDQF